MACSETEPSSLVMVFSQFTGTFSHYGTATRTGLWNTLFPHPYVICYEGFFPARVFYFIEQRGFWPKVPFFPQRVFAGRFFPHKVFSTFSLYQARCVHMRQINGINDTISGGAAAVRSSSKATKPLFAHLICLYIDVIPRQELLRSSKHRRQPGFY